MSIRLIQDLHAGISRRDWSAVETAANRLRDDIEETRRILAGVGIGSLPNDYPLPRLATDVLSTPPAEPPVERKAEPVAWRCKDYADGWILYDSELRARDYKVKTGCLMQPLYASPSPVGESRDGLIERLVKALSAFAEAADIFEREYGDKMKPDTGCNIKFSALCEARAVLASKEQQS